MFNLFTDCANIIIHILNRILPNEYYLNLTMPRSTIHLKDKNYQTKASLGPVSHTIRICTKQQIKKEHVSKMYEMDDFEIKIKCVIE